MSIWVPDFDFELLFHESTILLEGVVDATKFGPTF